MLDTVGTTWAVLGTLFPFSFLSLRLGWITYAKHLRVIFLSDIRYTIGISGIRTSY